jgi:hypothetical protein
MSNKPRLPEDAFSVHARRAQSKAGHHSRVKTIGMTVGAAAVLAAVSFTVARVGIDAVVELP